MLVNQVAKQILLLLFVVGLNFIRRACLALLCDLLMKRRISLLVVGKRDHFVVHARNDLFYDHGLRLGVR